jgi:hypothetical protein
MISPSFLLKTRNVSDKIYRENQNTHFGLNLPFFQKSYRLRDNVKKIPDRPQMTIWHTRLGCFIAKVTDTHSEYVLFIAFPMQQ